MTKITQILLISALQLTYYRHVAKLFPVIYRCSFSFRENVI